MFCPKCGNENPDTNQFCGKCGESLIKPSSNKTEKKWVYRPVATLIVMGVLLILAMYTIPIPGYGGSVTLAKQVDVCSSPLSSLLYRCPEALSWWFFGGWGMGILLIALGIFHRVKE
jgi:predicted nucleic acid-binding Zn ribbon protein